MDTPTILKTIECPICLGTTLEPNLHSGSVLCYYCHGSGYIGYTDHKGQIRTVLDKIKKAKK